MDKKSSTCVLDDTLDYKALTISSMFKAVEHLNAESLRKTSIDSKNQVLLMTSFGTVEGKLIDISSEEDIENIHPDDRDYSKILMQVLASREKSFIKECCDENQNLKLINHTSQVVLGDVTVKPYDNPLRVLTFAVLVLFADQIIGYSCGVAR